MVRAEGTRLVGCESIPEVPFPAKREWFREKSKPFKMRPLQAWQKGHRDHLISLDLNQVWLQTEPFQSSNYVRPREAAPPCQVLFIDLPPTLEAQPQPTLRYSCCGSCPGRCTVWCVPHWGTITMHRISFTWGLSGGLTPYR